MIDLHTHSTFSDGSLTPEELVALAVESGLTAMALTDHDTTAGVPRFLAAAEKAGLRALTGVEISAEASKGAMHMLGYGLDPDHPGLCDKLAWVRDGRARRNEVILRQLNDLGMELTWDEVRELAGDEVVGRPHFAEAMIRRGYASGRQEVFDRFLARGKPAYAERVRMTPEESVAAIRAAGGVPVLAHPFTLEESEEGLDRLVGQLRELGLEGIEVDYPEHNARRLAQYGQLAERWDLVRTGGTDFHGQITPDIRLGRGFGSLQIDDSVVDELERRRAAIRSASA